MKELLKKLLIIAIFIILCILVTEYIVKPNIKQQSDENSIVETTMEKYLNNIFEYHSSNYCGKLNYEDKYENYTNTQTYNTIKEIKDDYNKYLSEKYIEENIIKNFKEKDNKLYCLSKQSSDLKYNQNSFKITNINKTEKEIKVEGTFETEENELNPKETFNVQVELIKENDNWVINEYKEIYE